LRLDYPKVDEAPPYNAAFETAFGMRNDGTPDGNYTISPRLGFSYNLDSERKTQIRGGLGLFQGKNPAVWISNAYSNTGATGNVTLSNPAGAVFNPDPRHADASSRQPGRSRDQSHRSGLQAAHAVEDQHRG
jgi:hypothetical protein